MGKIDTLWFPSRLVRRFSGFGVSRGYHASYKKWGFSLLMVKSTFWWCTFSHFGHFMICTFSPFCGKWDFHVLWEVTFFTFCHYNKALLQYHAIGEITQERRMIFSVVVLPSFLCLIFCRCLVSVLCRGDSQGRDVFSTLVLPSLNRLIFCRCLISIVGENTQERRMIFSTLVLPSMNRIFSCPGFKFNSCRGDSQGSKFLHSRSPPVILAPN